MKSEHTGTTLTALILSCLALLSAPGLAGGHGAPEVDEVPEGFVKASITSQPDIQGLRALILDAPRPGIMLRYEGDDRLTVLGTEGEQFYPNAHSTLCPTINQKTDEQLKPFLLLERKGYGGQV